MNEPRRHLILSRRRSWHRLSLARHRGGDRPMGPLRMPPPAATPMRIHHTDRGASFWRNVQSHVKWHLKPPMVLATGRSPGSRHYRHLRAAPRLPEVHTRWGGRPLTASECQSGVLKHTTAKEASVGEVSTIGLDLAKTVFQAHGADASGGVVFRKKLRRGASAGFLRRPAALSGGDGSVRQRSLLGSRDWCAGPRDLAG